jgi:hypothetical protein
VINKTKKMANLVEEVQNELTFKGAFVDSLVRTNSQIRKDRAIAIAEEAEMKYRRMVDDLRLKLKSLKRSRENMLDLSPETKGSLILASDFVADDFIAKDLELGLAIRETEIKLEIAETQYQRLFTNGE